MKKRYFLILYILIPFYVHSQDQSKGGVRADSLITKEGKTDSISPVKEFLSQRADAIVGSLFGPSKQLSNADSILARFDDSPSFGIYKDNYFVLGTTLFKEPTQWNSDAKFQVSVRHRLTNSTLPFKTYFFLTYTQKAFWDVFRESFPFRDLNFNPSLGFGKALVRDNRFLGTVSLQFEHESNGKDEEDSRSWNKITFGSYFTLDDYWNLQAKAWVPIVDGGNNKDIVKYSGWGMLALNYSSPKRKYNIGAIVTKRGGVNLNANLELNLSIRLFSDDNQFLFFQYYNGYGESMLDYKEYRQRLRVGIIIKPDLMAIY